MIAFPPGHPDHPTNYQKRRESIAERVERVDQLLEDLFNAIDGIPPHESVDEYADAICNLPIQKDAFKERLTKEAQKDMQHYMRLMCAFTECLNRLSDTFTLASLADDMGMPADLSIKYGIAVETIDVWQTALFDTVIDAINQLDTSSPLPAILAKIIPAATNLQFLPREYLREYMRTYIYAWRERLGFDDE